MKILCFTVKEPRFCGSFSFFTWEQCKLGKIGSTYTGLSGNQKLISDTAKESLLPI